MIIEGDPKKRISKLLIFCHLRRTVIMEVAYSGATKFAPAEIKPLSIWPIESVKRKITMKLSA